MLSGIQRFIMSDESSIEDSMWQDEDKIWDSDEDFTVLTSQLCRICAEASDDLINCFGEQGQELQLVEKIHTHLPIMVTENDLLPINVCSSCATKLEVCHKLVLNCLEADARLRTILGFDEINEEQHFYNETEHAESIDKNEILEELEEESMTEVLSKTFNKEIEEKEEEKLTKKKVFGKKSNNIKKSSSTSEAKAGYKFLVLKMKKSSVIQPEVQIMNAMKLLKSRGKSPRANNTNRKSLILRSKEETFQPSKAPQTESEKGEDCDKDDENGNDESQTSNIKYECIYCDEGIQGKTEFVLHQKTAHKNKVYSCENCELVFELEDDFIEHIKTHKNDEESLMNVLDLKNAEVSRNGKRRNSNENLNPTKKFKFLEDDFDLAEFAMLKKLESKNDDKYWKCKVWQCRQCNHVSVLKDAWKLHECWEEDFQKEQNDHNEEEMNDRLEDDVKIKQEKTFQCTICGKLFKSWLQLLQHTRSHSTQYRCPHCESSFNRKSNLAAHMKRHKSEYGYTCMACMKIFPSRSEFMIHRRTHTRQELKDLKKNTIVGQQEGDSERSSTNITEYSMTYKCSVCHRLFQSEQRLDTHMALHTDTTFPCHICGKVLSKKNTLEYHLRTHTGEKPFTCSMCPGAFQSRVGLLVHERIHTGEKPYPCDQCEMAFRCRATLNQHKVVHSDERPFRCNHCGRGFRRRDTLDTHIRTHTNERPYACRICGRAFRQKGDCSKHERTHAKHAKSVMLITEEDNTTHVYSCPLCGRMYELKDDLDNHFDNEHTPEEKASSIVIINSENVITIPGITVEEETQGIVLHQLP